MQSQDSDPENHNRSQHHSRNDGSILLKSLDFDDFEISVLEIARFYFATFANPASQLWVTALQRAETQFEAPFGATIAHAILIAVENMREARQTGFSFLDPTCPLCSQYISPEERYFLSVLHEVRRHNKSAAKTNAMLICEGGDDQPLIESFARLAIITGDVDPTHAFIAACPDAQGELSV